MAARTPPTPHTGTPAERVDIRRTTISAYSGELPTGSAATYEPRVIVTRLRIQPDSRTEAEKLAGQRRMWDENDAMWGDSLEFFGPRP